jgi:hypothetical protein
MPLEAIYEKEDEIPEAHKELFTERDGKWELTGINGIKTTADVDRLNEALRKERTDHKGVKDKLAIWGDWEHEDVNTRLNRIPELEAAAEAAGKGGKIPEEKINELVEGRLAQQTGPLQRRIDELEKLNGTQAESITGFEGKDRIRKIHDSLRAAMAVEPKVLDTAHEDVLMLAERVFDVTDEDLVLVKDDVGAIPGADAKQWLIDMQEKRPHWWPPSQGGGAGGSPNKGGNVGASNPWATENWNITEQGKFVREHGLEKATAMAKRAGSHIGSPHAPKKA